MAEIDKYICPHHGMDFRAYCSDCTFGFNQLTQVLEEYTEYVREQERQGNVKGIDF